MKTISVEFWTKVRVKRIIQITDEAFDTLNGMAENQENGKYIDEAYIPNKKLAKEPQEEPGELETAYHILNAVPFFDEILERDNYIEQIRYKEAKHE